MTQTTESAVASYITDMLALEEHIENALSGQIKDLAGESENVRPLHIIRDNCAVHARALKAIAGRREQTGQGVAELAKKAVSSVLGVGAAAIDFLRTEKEPKMLRDDYAALSLATVGYVMLHTTALSLGDDEVAELAHRHLKNHAKAVMTLNNIIPGAVIRFLQSDGLAASEEVLPQIAENLDEVWRDGSGVPEVEES